jgi:hypothetical protein
MNTSLPLASRVPELALMIWPAPEIVNAVPASLPNVVFSELTVFNAEVTAETLLVTEPVTIPPKLGPPDGCAPEKSRFP